ncbi:hypothetical protein Tsubulata_028368 [Turnera subulata]|uniref:Uncharacterized protein n=1 Tax=Turnera subulata TaxID=218843 RepID=A0A9Q0FF58_9ROSI|nr:hypothetical protein Tsubulata_028368 [Turnera subulata]
MASNPRFGLSPIFLKQVLCSKISPLYCWIPKHSRIRLICLLRDTRARTSRNRGSGIYIWASYCIGNWSKVCSTSKTEEIAWVGSV